MICSIVLSCENLLTITQGDHEAHVELPSRYEGRVEEPRRKHGPANRNRRATEGEIQPAKWKQGEQRTRFHSRQEAKRIIALHSIALNESRPLGLERRIFLITNDFCCTTKYWAAFELGKAMNLGYGGDSYLSPGFSNDGWIFVLYNRMMSLMACRCEFCLRCIDVQAR
jgi:hypothetical protein